MTLAEKLDFLVKQSAKTKVEISKVLDLRSSSSFSQWIKGKTKPSRENIQKLASYFGKPVSYFADDDVPAKNLNMVFDNPKPAEEINAVPQAKLVGIKDSIYEESFVVSFYIKPEGYLPVLVEAPENSQPYGLKIESDNIFEGMKKGDIAIVSPSSESLNGKTALVKIQDTFQFKKVFFGSKNIILKNGKSQIKTQKDKFEIVGQVVGLFRTI